MLRRVALALAAAEAFERDAAAWDLRSAALWEERLARMEERAAAEAEALAGGGVEDEVEELDESGLEAAAAKSEALRGFRVNKG